MACVIIENVPYNEEDMLSLLRNTNIGIEMDGEVRSIEVDRDKKEATIYFSLFSDAEKLIKKGVMEYEFLQMSVKKPLPGHPEGVIIYGSLENDDEYLLKFYFRKKKNGGGNIEALECFDPENNFAVILFEKTQDARNVIEKHNHFIGEDKYTAWQWIPGEKKTSRTNSTSTMDEDASDEEEKPNSCIILAKGFPSTVKQDTIRRFFRSKKQSGGGPVNKVTAREDGSFIIIFEERSSMEGVLKRRDHLLFDENSIEVTELSIPRPMKMGGPTEEKMVYVHGDLAKISRQTLILYMEDISGIEVEDIKYGAKGFALVIFNEAFDYKILEREGMRRPCEEEILNFQKVKKSSTIQVFTKQEHKKYVLELHFENQKSGASGKVNVEYKGKNRYLVTFEEALVVERVISKEHRLGEEKLDVSIFYEELGLIPHGFDTSKPFPEIPTHHIVKEDPLMVKYVKETKEVTDRANKMLRSQFASLDPEHPVENEIKIICKLQVDTDNIRTMARNWNEEIDSTIKAFLSKFCHKTVSCPQDIWQDQTFERDPMVMIDKEYVIGPKDKMEELLNSVTQFREQAEDEQKSVTKEMDDIPAGQIEVLLKKGIKKTLREKWPKVRPIIHNEKIECRGHPEEILEVYMFIQKELKDIIEHEVDMSILQRKVISSDAGEKHIQILLENKEWYAVIECDADGVIVIGEKNTTKLVEKLLRDEVIESSMDIEDNQQVLQSPEWSKFIDNELESNQGEIFVEVHSDRSSINIAATKEIHELFRERLFEFLNRNTVKEDFIPAEKGCVELLSKYSQKDFQQVFYESAKYDVQVKPKNNSESCGFHISSISEGFAQAKEKVKGLIASVTSDSFIMKQPGLPHFLMSGSSTLMLQGVEAENKVIIEVVNKGDMDMQAMAQESSAPKTDVRYAVTTEAGVKITVTLGDISECKVDALVSLTNGKLKPEREWAKKLVQKGGSSIQEECDNFIKISDTLDVGDHVITTAGALRAKNIIHTVVRRFRVIEHEEAEALFECVSNVLQLAKDEGLHTIAIPATGAGMLDMPVGEVTEIIVEAIYSFLENNNDDYQFNTIDLFEEHKRNIGSVVAALKKRNKMSSTKSKQTFHRKMHNENPGMDHKDDDMDYMTVEGVKIKLVKGAIAEQTTKAIVNSVQINLDLSAGALSNSIMNAMDARYRKIVQAEAYKYEGKECGDVFSTGPGDLECQKIFHIIMPSWEEDPSVLRLLEDGLIKILSKCDESGLTSLAIPAIGTGNLGWPAHVIADKFFNAVRRFSKESPKAILKTVYFVIYPTDASCLQEFKNRLQSLGGSSASRRRAEGRAGYSPGHRGHVQDKLQIGNIELQVTTGDITKATTEGIVNSTNSDLDMSMGGVSQALAEAGGRSLWNAVRRIDTPIEPNTAVVTTSGDLDCKYVIHVDVESTKFKWKNIIKTCLQKAEGKGMKSLSFPALGTGVYGGNPGEMAMHLMEAVADFANSGSVSLTLVRVVIYQKELLQHYLSKMKEARHSKPATSSGSARESVTLNIHGFSQANIDEAHEAIELLWENERGDRKIGGRSDSKFADIIKTLSIIEEREIVSMCEQRKVTVDLDYRSGTIRLRGQLKGVSMLENNIRIKLYEKEIEESEKEHSQFLCQYIQWEYEERKSVFMPYNEDLNRKLEKAYSTGQKKVTLFGESDLVLEIVVDLQRMVQYDGEITKKIHRVDLSKSGYSLPDKWSPMNSDDKCIREKLRSTDWEYHDVSKAFLLTAPDYRILQIERIQNPTLYRRYAVHKSDMKVQNEKMLWHGTRSIVMEKINHVGFNRSFSGHNAALYGKGVYFARDARFSIKYCDVDKNGDQWMYYASVLAGEYCTSDHRYVEPPPKDPAEPTVLYDSTVDDEIDPKIFVVFSDTQVYPDYLIKFRKL